MKVTSLAILALQLLPTLALAAPARDEVERALNGVELIPTRPELLRLTPDAAAVLRDIALRPNPRRMLARTRAITLLRLFPEARTRATLKQIIRATARPTDGVQRINLQQALTSYATVAGPKALGVIRPFLSHAHKDVRYGAAEALRLTRSPQAAALLRQRARLERSPMVRHQLKQQLRLINRPKAR